MPPGIRYEQIGHNPALENPDDYAWGCAMAYDPTEHDEDACDLYTDAEEVLFDATRPVILNGITPTWRRARTFWTAPSS